MNFTEASSKRLWKLLLPAGLLAVTALYCITPLHNGNFFWHLRNGEDILETGTIRTEDPFTWTCAGDTWLQQEWLAEVGFALAWKTGESGPVLFKTVLILMSVLLVYMAARRRGASPAAVVTVALLWFVLSHGRWIVRPHIVSIFFFSLYLYLLARGTGGLLSSLAVFVPLQIVWTNCHAGFIMGYFLLGIPLLENLLKRRWKKSLQSSVLLISVMSTCVIHPNGFGSVLYITDFLSRPLYTATIREWWSPFDPRFQPGSRVSSTAIVLSALLLLTLLLMIIRRKKLDMARAVGLAALAAATVMSSRNIDMLALAAVAWTSPLLKRVPRKIPAFMLAAAAAVPFLWGIPREFGPPKPLGAGVNWSIYPRQLTEFLKENEELLEARVYNTNEIAGYLQYVFEERLPLYMDGRCHLFSERLYAQYLLLAYARESDAAEVMRIMDSQEIQLALYDWPKTEESSAYVLAAHPQWRPVYWDSITVVYGRASWLDTLGSDRFGFTVVDPLFNEPFLETPLYAIPVSWEGELERSALPPMNFTPSIISAAALRLSRGREPDLHDFILSSDSLEISLKNALEGSDPWLDDTRLKTIQIWSLARRDSMDRAVSIAEELNDPTVLSCLRVIGGEPGIPAAPPPLIPSAKWQDYLSGELSSADSAMVEASALFTAGLRDSAMILAETTLREDTIGSPWAFSVSGYLASLSGMDSLAVLLGDSALALNRNPYTLMVAGNIRGNMGMFREGIRFLTESIEGSGAFHIANYLRAGYLWQSGRIAPAVEDYRLLRRVNYLSPASSLRLQWGERFTRSP